jgi:uncharacterized protein
MRWIARVALVAFIAYAVVVGMVYYSQRSLQYPAQARITDVVEAQLDGFEDILLQTPDGETLRGFWKPPEPGRALTLYFHGNGGSLWNRRDRVRALADEGHPGDPAHLVILRRTTAQA